MQIVAGRETFEALGTLWQIDLAGFDERRRDSVMQAVRRRLDTFDRVYSRFRGDSLVAAMARAAGTYALPADAAPMFELYRRMYELTDGAMTPLVGGLMADAGYDAAYSLRERREGLRATPRWDDVMTYANGILELNQPAWLDFGAIGKGQAVDLVSEIIEAAGATDYCVDAGGDIRHRSGEGETLRVGLEHPERPGEAIGVATVGNASLCGSAGNRRKWGRWNHIINPHTQSSPRDIAAVWAVAASTGLADGLTTALYFAKPVALQAEFAFEYAIMYRDGLLEYSRYFPAEFFMKDTA